MEILAERILLHNLGHLTAAEKFNNFQNNFFFGQNQHQPNSSINYQQIFE